MPTFAQKSLLVRDIRLFCVVIFATLTAFAATPTQATIFTRTDIGVQFDHLRWNISTPTFNPNILSELTFKSLSPIGRLNFAWFREGHPWVITAQYGFGYVVTGTVKDEDFNLNNRQGLFSKSKHDAHGHNVQSGQFRIGYSWFNGNRSWITPHLGFQWKFARFNITGGKRIVPDNDVDFSKLNSEYRAQWLALSVGGTFHHTFVALPLSITLDGSFFPFADYSGKGVWNLRSDFAQDPSFEHDATGIGAGGELKFQYRLTPRWRVGVGAQGQWFRATDGSDVTYFSDGSKISIPFRRVVHRTLLFFFSLSHQW